MVWSLGHRKASSLRSVPSFPLLLVFPPLCSLKRWWCSIDIHTVLQCFQPRNLKEGNTSVRMDFRESKAHFCTSIIPFQSRHSFLRGISYPLLTTAFNWVHLTFISHSVSDCKGSIPWSHTVRSEGSSLRFLQQEREPQMVHGNVAN